MDLPEALDFVVISEDLCRMMMGLFFFLSLVPLPRSIAASGVTVLVFSKNPKVEMAQSRPIYMADNG